MRCSPVCDPECVNAACSAPNTCVCYPGHVITNTSNSTCYDICDSCINAACRPASPAKCYCFEGYQPDTRFEHVCYPVCSPPCVNSTCTAPNKCECYDKFVKDPNNTNICAPKCTKMCIFGTCTDPDECTCFDGYINDLDSPNVCVPQCTPSCEKGYCERPNSCVCWPGFQLHPKYPYKCIPHKPANSTLSTCEVKLPKAIKYGETSDCYTMKENVKINSRQCEALNNCLPRICRQGSSCSLGECVFNFRCSTEFVNTSKEIHCDLETDDFGEEDNTNMTVDASDEWLDVDLVLNLFKHFNASTTNVMQNKLHEYTLQQSSKW